MQPEGIHRSLAGGIALIAQDPVGVLLPTGGILLLQVLGVVVIRQAVWVGDWTRAAWLAAALIGGRAVYTAPLRALVLASGSRALGRPIAGLRRTPSLLVAGAITSLCECVLVGAVALLAALLVHLLIGRGQLMPAAIVVSLATLLAAWLVLMLRTAFAYTGVLATAGQRGPLAAVFGGLGLAARDPLGALAVTLAGEATLAAGSLLCGAGALPGYPVADLAALHRWVRATEAPT